MFFIGTKDLHLFVRRRDTFPLRSEKQMQILRPEKPGASG